MTNELFNKRENWIDLIKGISALFVMLTHISDTPFMYKIFYSYIMLPAFFFASGYLTKNETASKYLYNRVLKLMLIYIIYSVITFFVSVKNIMLLIKEPISFLGSFLENLMGKSLWFIACLIVVSIIFCVIKTVTQNNSRGMFIVSAVLFVLGLIFTVEGRKLWSIDTAVICQFFFISGYVVKQVHAFDKIKNINVITLVSGVLYVVLIYGAFLVLGETAVGITIGTNIWKMQVITIPALVLGNVFIILLAKKIDFVPLVNYIGRHALIYYVFASHGLSLFLKIFKLIGLYNPYITNLLIVLLTAIVMAFVCKFIDKFLPFLNGQFKLPRLNNI